ncbi:hypothetical protein C1I97_01765 [Streptomyces sp. NTH33]|nr:hypothetical protein C1I97_01765 [Streptomyces sp. NTH33]
MNVGDELLTTTAPTLGSVRVMHQLDDLRIRLEPHRAYRPVRDLLARLDQAKRARILLLADILTPVEGSRS